MKPLWYLSFGAQFSALFAPSRENSFAEIAFCASRRPRVFLRYPVHPPPTSASQTTTPHSTTQ